MKILGDLLEKCGRAIGRMDGATFAQATEALAGRLVAAGFGVVDGDLPARVTATTAALRTLLTEAAKPGADAIMKARVESIALACSHADVRGTKFGYPPIPSAEPENRTETGRRRRASGKLSRGENGRTGKDAASGTDAP